MNEVSGVKMKGDTRNLVQCVKCKHFGYFYNEKGHNTPQALGKCGTESWDGKEGQWPEFRHPCKNFSVE